ncbi:MULTISPECIES: CNNM domain-containing protein [Moraxella]|nr:MULTISPECIES: hemolysin family protein [Moraxella]MBE9579019.1 HlyC/CorC family transporter [Moraxella sp. K1664]MBE9588340.1 HlyC/CorC family transporter [Moraxella sp. K1630]MBE9589516.1 HlyC/CorC family transporter [Moraxella sp. K127]MBE9596518.1 HlyC/CorC family transporter [Moraxella sp. K2450]MDH9218907.1 hemolysin family protein [Moraxella lacunata]
MPRPRFFLIAISLLAITPIIAFATAGESVGQASSTNVILLIFYVALSLIVSFICSISEATLLTMTPSYIDTLRDDNPKTADLLNEVKVKNIEKSISSILTLNTIANTLGSLGAGSQATIVFGSAWFGVFSGVMTLAVLMGSEIIPKTLGATYWRRFAVPVAYYVKGISILLFPIVWIAEKVSRLLTQGNNESGFNRHEFIALANQGEVSGQMSELETRIIKNSLALSMIHVESIVTPRSVMIAFDENMTVGDVFATHPKLPFSRFPIFDEDLDNATGFVLKSDLLIAKANQEIHTPIKHFKRDITFVFAKMKLFDVLDLMLKERLHIALVVGEFGEVKGIVSLEDVLETLLGLEIVDEIDRVDDMQALARQLMDRRMSRLGTTVADDENVDNVPNDNKG